MATGATVILLVVGTRYRAPMVPAVIAFAGAGLSTLVERARSKEWRRLRVLTAIALLAFGISMVMGDPRSDAYRFWTNYGKAFPQYFRLFFRGGYWIKLLAPAAAFAEYKLNLQTPNTALGHTIYDLHMVITWICVVIFVVVFGFMFYAVYAHRKSVGHKAANFHEHFWVEVGWTVVPAIILVAMAWPATRSAR